MKNLIRIHDFLKSLPTIYFIGSIVCIDYVIYSMLFGIYSLLGIDIMLNKSYIMEFESTTEMIFILIFFAPIVETFIFQFLLINVLLKIRLIKSAIAVVVISAIIFAIGHSYNIYGNVYIFISGILLSYSFILYIKKRGSAFWVVTAIHGLMNFIACLPNLINS